MSQLTPLSGARLVLGLLLILGGVLGFLPVLGFWMIPLGIAVAALDIRPLWQALRSHRQTLPSRHSL